MHGHMNIKHFQALMILWSIFLYNELFLKNLKRFCIMFV